MTACGLGLVDRHLAGQLRPPTGTAGPAFGLLGCLGSGFTAPRRPREGPDEGLRAALKEDLWERPVGICGVS